MDFSGFAAPLSPQCLDHVAQTLATDLPAIWAVLSVETAGCGFLADKRLKILFERHKFHEFTQGRFDAAAPDLSQPTAGGYGASGANQYERLQRAMALDESAALRSASYGLAQIMGFNSAAVGFDDVRDMIKTFSDSEDQQVGAMAAFITGAGLDGALSSGDWAAFAAGYNGASFAKNGYDKSLALFHARYATGPLPDLTVRAVQLALTFIGIPNVGGVDGWFGDNTQKALLQFQQNESLPATGQPDAATVAAVMHKAGW